MRWFAIGRVLVGLALTWASLLPARAELAWLENRLVLEPAVGAEVAVGQFRAVNRGKTPVRIAGIQSGCGCTAATPDRDSIPPGGVATVEVTYRVGDRQTNQTVALTVKTEEPAPRTYDLSLDVRIKPFAVLTPDVCVWQLGEDATPKVIQLGLSNGFRLVTMESTTREFSAQIVRQSDALVDVKVTPRDLWAKRTGTIVFSVAQPGARPIAVTARLRIQ